MTSTFTHPGGFTITCDGDHGLLPGATYRDTDVFYPDVHRRMMAAGWMVRGTDDGPAYLCQECSGKPRRGANR